MISLKKSIEAFDYRSMWQAAMDTFSAALKSLEKHALPLDQEGLNRYRGKLSELQAKMDSVAADPNLLQELSHDLDSELRKYRLEIETLLKGSSSDLRDVVAVLAEAAESLSQRDTMRGGQLSRISGSLEAISHIDDIKQVRITLNRQVSELRNCISTMERDSETAVASLQKELTTFQTKLEKIQVEASTDPLTGLANRRRGMREISNRIRSRQPFGVLLFDLNGFKQINDTFGHGAGDVVLQTTARRLTEQAVTEDLVCRWGGDEFVVVRNGRAADLAPKSRAICDAVTENVKCRVDGKEVEISLGAAAGWADYQDGETVEELLARADKMMYQKKTPAARFKTAADEAKVRAFPLPSPSPAALKPVPPNTLAGVLSAQDLEAELEQISGERSSWFLCCFAVRFADKINAHYGFAAAEAVLPHLEGEIKKSKFGRQIYQSNGASLMVLTRAPGAQKELEAESRRLASIRLEKSLKQSEDSSLLPISLGVKMIASPDKAGLRELRQFVIHQKAAHVQAQRQPSARSNGKIAAPNR